MDVESDARAGELALDNPLILVIAPPGARDAIAAIARLDKQLSQAMDVARTSEPMLAQIRLSWWREQLADVATYSGPDPILQDLRGLNMEASALERLVDSWERLVLCDRQDANGLASAAERRGGAICALVCAVLDRRGENSSGLAIWGIVTMALSERDSVVRAALLEKGSARAAMSRETVPGLVRLLDGWAGRIATRNGSSAPFRDQLYLFRKGLAWRRS